MLKNIVNCMHMKWTWSILCSHWPDLSVFGVSHLKGKKQCVYNLMCLCGLRLKKHIMFHILFIIVTPLCSTFLKRVDFSKLIGVLWLASYPVRCDWPAIRSVVIGRIPQACDRNVTPLTVFWCCVPARRHTKNKTRYKWGICCIRWGHNYCL